MEEPQSGCLITDAPEVMAAKIHAAIARERPNIRHSLALAARQSKGRVRQGDRAFNAAFASIVYCTREAYAEYLLPRAIIREDEHELRQLRDAMDRWLERNIPGLPPGPPEPLIPSWTALPDAVHRHLSAAEFDERVRTVESYHKLDAALKAADKLIPEGLELVQRQCAYRCGTFAPLLQCSSCLMFYCSDSCRDGHITLKQCKPP